jgi:hypothetical protein
MHMEIQPNPRRSNHRTLIADQMELNMRLSWCFKLLSDAGKRGGAQQKKSAGPLKGQRQILEQV